MNFFKKIKSIFYGLMFVILFTGCSPSSRSQRYNQPKNGGGETSRTKDEQPSQRFDKSNNNDITVVQDLPDSNDDEFDEIPVEENPVDKSKFVEHYEKLKDFNVTLTPREKILFEVIKYLDTPYKYGGNSSKGIDCSAFTKQVFENSVTLDLPRSAREQYGVGEKISKDELKFGDLVFFNTRRRNNPGHVGIYLGDNQFVHASRTLGVTVSSLDEKYYKTRYIGARRVIENSDRQSN
jgi:cell wall-associated NlpC family hydrolase